MGGSGSEGGLGLSFMWPRATRPRMVTAPELSKLHNYRLGWKARRAVFTATSIPQRCCAPPDRVPSTSLRTGSDPAPHKPQRQEISFKVDEGPRADTSIEALGALKAAFHVKGVTTAGNSSQMSDGAAAAVVMSAERAKALGIAPLARYVAFATAGYKPEEMGLGPVFAIPKALKLAGLKLSDIDVIELNEAFAAQSLAVIREAGLDLERVNPNGGAIALGHPLGCTGAKLTASVIRELKRRNGRYGMVTMCVGGGMGAAGIFENLS